MVPINLISWLKVIKDTSDGIADENLQRRSWFGLGPEISNPGEEFNALLGDAAIEDFLKREDTGLDYNQIEAGRHLASLMRALSDQTPAYIEAANLIDDPRWKEIRKAAASFSKLLEISLTK